MLNLLISVLTAAEEAEMRQAFRDVMDTVALGGGINPPTLVTIRHIDDLSLDPANEDRGDRSFTEETFYAQVEYNNGSKTNEDTNMAGTWDNSDVRALIHLDLLEAAGWLVNDYPIINPTIDQMIVNNGDGTTEIFRITHVDVDGAIGKRQVYTIIRGYREEQFQSKVNA